MQRAIERLNRVNVLSMERAFKRWNFMNKIGNVNDFF